MNRLNELIAEHGVLVAAHRGSAGANIPCNTIPAFDIAMKYGARILEMDIFRSTDGKLFVFHTGKEKNQLAQNIDLTAMSSAEIEAMRLLNAEWNPTTQPVNAFDDVLEHLKGRDVLLNLDRFAEIIEDVIACVERHGMREQILLKTPPKPEALAAIERFAPDYMYMPICWEEDSCIETIEQMHINLVGAELVFLSEQAPVIQPETLQRLRDKGLVLWGNALLYSDAVPLAAGHSDDVSLLDDPAKGWGWLADKGFGIIQTDWTLHCCQYLREKGYSR